MKDAVINYSEMIGRNPALIQGAGGNVSWKEDNTLWVKASGTWLADAKTQDIFIPVELNTAKASLAENNGLFQAKVLSAQSLRPSIETALHVLMPHRVVVHVHAVDVIAQVVKNNFANHLSHHLDSTLAWGWTDYYKPGLELAYAVAAVLNKTPHINAVFLANHGVIVGGENVEEVDKILNTVLNNLTLPSRTLPDFTSDPTLTSALTQLCYSAAEMECQYLAFDPICVEMITHKWALYPDHVVFLGAAPNLFNDWETFNNQYQQTAILPDYLIFPGQGVFTSHSCNNNKIAMLHCYADVLRKLANANNINTLSTRQIAELLDWDAEKYRKQLAK